MAVVYGPGLVTTQAEAGYDVETDAPLLLVIERHGNITTTPSKKRDDAAAARQQGGEGDAVSVHGGEGELVSFHFSSPVALGTTITLRLRHLSLVGGTGAAACGPALSGRRGVGGNWSSSVTLTLPDTLGVTTVGTCTMAATVQS